MNVAQYIAEFIVAKGVKHVFGYQGGAILKLIDEMVATGNIEYIQNYHEQSSAFCADAYARVSHNFGVAIGTSGPGATNLITGIANAQLDSIPTMFITGQDYLANVSKENGARQNGFQDLDIVQLVTPITKYAKLINNASDIRYELEKAYFLATAGRPGAVVLDIPIDIQFQVIDKNALMAFNPSIEGISDIPFSDVVKRIKESKRAVIIVGGGVQAAQVQLDVEELVGKTGIPVVSTLNGLDAYSQRFGFAGLHGNTYANLAIQNADLILALGCRFGQRQVGKIPANYTSAHVVHVDIDENELNRVFTNGTAIKADLKQFLQCLNQYLAEARELPSFQQWTETIRRWQEKYHSCAYMNTAGLDPVKFVEHLSPLLMSNAVIVNDVGQNQMWVAQGLITKRNQRVLNSCGLGSMGYSLPASIGAKYVDPSRQVIAFSGDGGFQMNVQELMLVSHRNVGIKCLVFNNNTLGMMREVQARYYNEHYYGANKQEFRCVDLKKLAETYSLKYCKVESLDDIDDLKAPLCDAKPWIIEVIIPFDSKLSNRYDEAEIFDRERL